jgi:hypothetical protein
MDIKKQHTLIIIDWDDTLFPTTWVSTNRINIYNANKSSKTIKYFKLLDSELSSLINTLSNYGEIVIVTNALPEWIQISSIVLPLTCNLLKNIKIYSARKMFQGKYPYEPMKWKELAFKEILSNKYENGQFANIISIGDADYEHNALIKLINYERDVSKLLKSVRFIKNPSNNILLEQINTLKSAFPIISQKKTHMDLSVEYCNSQKVQ